MKSLVNQGIKSVHFVGIGGIGVSGLARHLLACGCNVSGSDRTRTALTESLSNQGIAVYYGHNADNVPKQCDLVVYSSAVPLDNCELQYAKQRNIPILLREQLLGIIFDSYKQRIAVSGVHGKTTVSAMLDYVLRTVSVSHTAFVGGVLENCGTNYCKGENIVVAEACEFRQSFLCLHPNIAVVLNVELDHPDCYPDVHSLYNAFDKFLNNMTADGIAIVNGDQVDSTLYISHNNLTFGLNEHNHFRAINLQSNHGKYSFDLTTADRVMCNVHLNVYGKHNVYNALATLVVLFRLGLDIEQCADILSKFVGAERRFEYKPCPYCTLVEDYAHHPTEIMASVATAKEVAKGKVWLFFQPHTYTRTKALWDNFVNCFDGVHFVGVLDIYSAREQPIDGIDSQTLARDINSHGTLCKYLNSLDSAKQFVVDNVDKDDLVLVVGAGDIYKLSQALAQ